MTIDAGAYRRHEFVIGLMDRKIAEFHAASLEMRRALGELTSIVDGEHRRTGIADPAYSLLATASAQRALRLRQALLALELQRDGAIAERRRALNDLARLRGAGA